MYERQKGEYETKTGVGLKASLYAMLRGLNIRAMIL
jgi:hypothetical protein